MHKGIWRYDQLGDVPVSSRLTLGEGDTEIEHVKFLDTTIVIKREDNNPGGSFKDRSLAYQVSKLVLEGERDFVISSSGNAAISAAAYVKAAGANLNIFISENVNSEKLRILETHVAENVRLHKVKKPKSDAIKMAAENGAHNLRGSADPYAVPGFSTIAYELSEQFPEIDAVFIPCSSGTSSVGIAEGFDQLSMKVQVHVCQTARINPIAKLFDNNFQSTETSLADAISDRVAKRKTQVEDIVKQTGGSGWVLEDDDLTAVAELLGSKAESISWNSMLSLAGFAKALKNNHQFNNPVAIISGL